MSDVVILPPSPRPTECGARTRMGGWCKRPPVPGTNRCSAHGGGSSQVRQAVAEQLAAEAFPALKVLHDVMAHWNADVCPTCGRPSGDPSPAIRAAIAVLDRTGFAAGLKLEVKQDHEISRDSEFVQWMPSWQLAMLDRWSQDAIERMQRGEPAADVDGSLEPPPDAIDGVVVQMPDRKDSDQ